MYEPTPTMNHGQRSHHTSYRYVNYVNGNVFFHEVYLSVYLIFTIVSSFRQEIIERLQQNHMLVILVTNSLTSYMDKARQEAKGLKIEVIDQVCLLCSISLILKSFSLVFQLTYLWILITIIQIKGSII